MISLSIITSESCAVLIHDEARYNISEEDIDFYLWPIRMEVVSLNPIMHTPIVAFLFMKCIMISFWNEYYLAI